jgi:hypothetical protein
MKVLLSLLKGIIAVYLVAICLIYGYYFTQKELYDVEFPFLQDYSYYKILDDEYEPDYQKGDFVFVKKGYDVKEDDYVIYLENKNIVRFQKIVSKNGALLTLKNPNSKTEQTTIDMKNVLAVAVYENDLLSLILKLITEPVAIIVIFVISVLLPEVKYRKF